MDACGRIAITTNCLARESPFQCRHCALWESEVIQEAGDAGRLVEFKSLMFLSNYRSSNRRS